MSDEYLKERINKSEEDYQVAITLLQNQAYPTPNAVTFHCQQCCEKYLKAFLVKQKVFFPKTHDLIQLHTLCVIENPEFNQLSGYLDQLNPYSVEFRYPGSSASSEEANNAVEAIKHVRRFVKEKLV